MRLLTLAAVTALGAACPALPTPAPRPRAHLASLGRGGAGGQPTLRVELALSGDEARLAPVAVDWELTAGTHALVRGRSAGLVFVIAVPPGWPAGAEVRLSGAVHLEGPHGRAFAPFDEAVRLP